MLILRYLGFPDGSVVKNLPASEREVGDTGSIPGSGRFPEGGHGNPLQYSCLENCMDRGAWSAAVCGVTESRTWLSRWACMHTKIFFLSIFFQPDFFDENFIFVWMYSLTYLMQIIITNFFTGSCNSKNTFIILFPLILTQYKVGREFFVWGKRGYNRWKTEYLFRIALLLLFRKAYISLQVYLKNSVF